MTPKEQSRLRVINSLAAEHMTLDQAAELMGITSRHARRILAAYREHRAAALARGHRGRRSVNATQEALIADVTHLARTRYAGVTTPTSRNCWQAQAALDGFVPRFNRRFGVPPQCSDPTFRPRDPELCLEQVLCFKHRRRAGRDDTVRFQLRTLQLLPAPERPSDAGATVEVLEGLDGQLSVRHEGRIVAAQEAPPDPVSLRNGHAYSADPPIASIGVNHWGERWTADLMPLISSQEPEAGEVGVANDELAVVPPLTVAPRKPTFLQKERCKTVQKSRSKGMSLRAIERDHGSTIRNYLGAGGPPKRRSRTVSTSSPSGTIAT